MITQKPVQQPKTEPKDLPVIGNSVRIKVAGIAHIPAKVDTGATISSIWASDIRLAPDNRLEFSLFAQN